jgi:hypothetical protein
MADGQSVNSKLTLAAFAAAILACTLLLPACNIKEKKEGEKKKVDISTPFGELKVREDADAKDTGLPVYPNSRAKPGDKNDENKSANVNLSFGKFGLKVAVATYETDATPDKVLAFYRTEVGKYGKVLECKGGSIGNVNIGNDDKDNDKEIHCDKNGDSSVTELKVGGKGIERVVAVKPNGKGTEFSLVYVRTSGDDKEEPI